MLLELRAGPAVVLVSLALPALVCARGDVFPTDQAPHAGVSTSSDNPDVLFGHREDLASVKRAAEIWSASATTDFDAAWKLARAAYWLGGHAAQDERRTALERGIVAGETAARLRPDRPEGHYWLAADMGALAESFGLSQGLKYRSRIRSELERVLAIDPEWEQASAVTALGRWYYLVPRLFGGSHSKADEYFRRALERFPNSVTASFFLAESKLAEHKPEEARHWLQRVVDAPVDPEWAPEIREFKRKAAATLRTLSAVREP
jgi:tetratricopeptide (TPR) repeat protein